MEPHLLFVLCLAFFGTALVYASVGFGGGASYTALLALTGMTTAWIPVLSLSCNLIIPGGGSRQFSRRGHLKWNPALPLLAMSMPAAYLAGQVFKPESVGGLAYIPILAVAVLVGGQIGSHWGAGILPQAKLRRITACLILFVSIRILSGIYFL